MDKPKILIVDDKEENLFALESTLDDLVDDIEIIQAVSGKEAIRKCLETEFALVLMDVQMPEMDGFEAMNHIHQDSMNRDTPVIFLSAIYSDDSYKIRGISEGAVDFISKPIVEGILVGKVNVFLRMYDQKKKLVEQMKSISSLNRDMENFNRILAHDLKQPLHVMRGYIDLVLLDEENLSADSRDSLETVVESVDNMANLISEVLELVKTRNTEVLFEKIAAGKEISDIISMYGKQGEKRINITSDAIPEIVTNKALFSSIFRNLIGNSIKYNEHDTIEIKISYRKNGSFHRFCVSDNGIGIPAEKYEEIFLPFTRVQEDAKYAGTGVGLSIVHSAVEKLGGKIEIEKSDKSGTTICIDLPELEEK